MRPKATLRVRASPSIHLLKNICHRFEIISRASRLDSHRCQLTTAGLNIDAAPDANGAGNTGFLQDTALKRLRPLMGGGLTGEFMGGVEWYYVNVTKQALEQDRQFPGGFRSVIDILDQRPFKSDTPASLFHIIPTGDQQI